MTNYVTKKTLEKVTDNGQTWAQRLAGADVMTKYHAYSVLEALRLEYGMVTGFEKLILPQPAPEHTRAGSTTFGPGRVCSAGLTVPGSLGYD